MRRNKPFLNAVLYCSIHAKVCSAECMLAQFLNADFFCSLTGSISVVTNSRDLPLATLSIYQKNLCSSHVSYAKCIIQKQSPNVAKTLLPSKLLILQRGIKLQILKRAQVLTRSEQVLTQTSSIKFDMPFFQRPQPAI
jgi:hypothetical protein